jgi:lipopolysaccharide export system protein LptC
VNPAVEGPVIAAAMTRRPSRWQTRLAGLIATYLPLLVMAMLALGSWWLVKNTPVDEGRGTDLPQRHEPDYTMRDFTVQRFGRDGTLRGEIQGDLALHYPDTDTLEIENPRIRSLAENGRVTVASARRALSNADGSEVQLLVGARVTREATGREAEIDFRGDFLHVFLNSERVRSHLPVTVTQGGTQVEAAGMDYDNLTRIVDLKGRVHAVFPGRPR